MNQTNNLPTPPGFPQSGIRDNYHRGSVGDFLKAEIKPDSLLSIVSAYFTIYAFSALKNELTNIDRLRFLFGELRFVKSWGKEYVPGYG
jgi:hypothetical protein